MNRLLKSILINIVLLLCISINCGFAAEDLLDIYKLSLAADSELKQSQIAYEIALEIKHQDISRLLPHINISGDIARNWQKRTYEISGFDGKEEYRNHGYTLTAKQPLIRYDNNIMVKQANNRIKEADAELVSAGQSLILRVAERYFEVLAAQDSLHLIEAEKLAVVRQLKQAERRLEAGMVAITDVYEAKARLDTTIAQEVEAQNQLADNLETLRETTNKYHNKLRPLSESFVLETPKPMESDVWVELAVQNNLQIVALRQNNQLLKREISRQRAGHYPTLDLVANYSKMASGGGDFGNSDTENRTVGLQLNIPIYQGGVVSSRVKEAVYRYEQNLEKIDETLRLVRNQVHKAYRGVIASIARVSSLQQSVVSNSEALKAIKAGHDAGMRTTSDVLQATQEVYRSQRNYERARYDFVLNGLKLKQLAGDLSLSDLQKVNLWLEK